jgi:hypothetical protein
MSWRVRAWQELVISQRLASAVALRSSRGARPILVTAARAGLRRGWREMFRVLWLRILIRRVTAEWPASWADGLGSGPRYPLGERSPPSGYMLATRRVCARQPAGARLPPSGCVPATQRVRACHPAGACMPPSGCVPVTQRVRACHPAGARLPPSGCAPATQRVRACHPAGAWSLPGGCAIATLPVAARDTEGVESSAAADPTRMIGKEDAQPTSRRMVTQEERDAGCSVA